MRQTGNSLQRLDVDSDDLALILAAARAPISRRRRRARLPAGGGVAALLAIAGAEASDDLSFGKTDFSAAETAYRTAESAADLFDFAAICETAIDGVFTFAHEHGADAASHRGHHGDAFASPFASPFGGLVAHAGHDDAAHQGGHGRTAAAHDAHGTAAAGHGAHGAGQGHAAHDAGHDGRHGGGNGAQNRHVSADDHGNKTSGGHDSARDRSGDPGHEAHGAGDNAAGSAASGHGHAGHESASPVFASGGDMHSTHPYYGDVAGQDVTRDLDDALTALLGSEAAPASVASSPPPTQTQANYSLAHADHAPPEIIASTGVDI